MPGKENNAIGQCLIYKDSLNVKCTLYLSYFLTNDNEPNAVLKSEHRLVRRCDTKPTW